MSNDQFRPVYLLSENPLKIEEGQTRLEILHQRREETWKVVLVDPEFHENRGSNVRSGVGSQIVLLKNGEVFARGILSSWEALPALPSFDPLNYSLIMKRNPLAEILLRIELRNLTIEMVPPGHELITEKKRGVDRKRSPGRRLFLDVLTREGG